ncbi:MAG: response regulator, partial [Planctomycetota bacterium]
MSSKKILVIDDEPDVIQYMSLFLYDEGFEVISAADGPQGLAKASEESPDLITLDITMPGMSGIEVLTTLRRDPKLCDIPVIVITGVAGIKKLMDYREVRPPEKFMQKPIDRIQLVKMIEELIDSA